MSWTVYADPDRIHLVGEYTELTAALAALRRHAVLVLPEDAVPVAPIDIVTGPVTLHANLDGVQVGLGRALRALP